MTTKTDTKTSSLIINELTKDQYTQALEEGQINEDELYLVTGEEYTKGEIDKLVQDTKDELQTLIDTKPDNTDVVHKDGLEVITGQKVFQNKLSNTYEPADKSIYSDGLYVNTELIGGSLAISNAGNDTTSTSTRECDLIIDRDNCANDSNARNQVKFQISSDGSFKFAHTRKATHATATAKEDSQMGFNAEGVYWFGSGTKGSPVADAQYKYPILHTGNLNQINLENYCKGASQPINNPSEPTGNILKTTAKTLFGSINELFDKIQEGGKAIWGSISGNITDQSDLKNALDGKQPVGDYATNERVDTVEGAIPSIEGLATETYVNNHHDNTKQDVISNLSTIESNASNGASAYTTVQGYGDIVTHNAIEFALKSEIPDVSKYALDSDVVHKASSESITGQKTFKLNNTFANNTLDAIFANGIFIGDGTSTTTSRLFNTRWCNNAFQIKTSQDIGYSYLAGSNSTNYGLKYQVQRMPSRSSQPTGAGVVEAGMVLSYDGLIVGYSEQANKKVNDNEFIYVLDQKSVKTKTIDTLATTDKTIIGAINEVNTTKQDKLISGTNIKTINNESILGAGNFDVSSIEPLSQEEYDRRKEAGELDENKYYSTPTDISLQLLEVLYPVGSLYITTTSTCPLATLGIGTWILEATDRVLQGAGSRGAVGTTIEAGLPNISGSFDVMLNGGLKDGDYPSSLTSHNTYGAFYREKTVNTDWHFTSDKISTNQNGHYAGRFSASRSNPIYGNSDTVQMNAYLVNIYRRVS